MKKEHLEEFIVLSHYLNFCMAASKLHLAQSTLSKHISELEKELGVELFSRGKTISLTPAGAAFQERILPVNHLLKEAIAYARKVDKNTLEQLIIQEPYNMDLMSSLIYKAIGFFRNQSSTGFVKLLSESGRSSTELLDSNIVDIAATVDYGTMEKIKGKTEESKYYFCPIVQERLVAWVHKDGTLANLPTITPRVLSSKKICMTAARQFDPMRISICSWFLDSIGTLPDLHSLATTSINDFYSYTQDSDSVFIITPSMTTLPVLAMNDDMKVIEIDDDRAVITSSLVARSDYSKKSIDLFLDIISAIAKEIENVDG